MRRPAITTVHSVVRAVFGLAEGTCQGVAGEAT